MADLVEEGGRFGGYEISFKISVIEFLRPKIQYIIIYWYLTDFYFININYIIQSDLFNVRYSLLRKTPYVSENSSFA